MSLWMRRRPPMLGTTFVDEETERRNAGFVLAAIAAFLISGWYSFRELNYALRSETVDAKVLRMFEYTVPTRHGRSRPRLGIEYQFTDRAQQSREDRDWVPLPSTLQGAATVRVQYLPGPNGHSRLAVNRSYWGPIIFLICLGTVVIALFRLIHEANAPIRRKRRRTRA